MSGIDGYYFFLFPLQSIWEYVNIFLVLVNYRYATNSFYALKKEPPALKKGGRGTRLRHVRLVFLLFLLGRFN